MLYVQRDHTRNQSTKTLTVNSMDYSKDYNDLPASFFDGEEDNEKYIWLDDFIIGGLEEPPINTDIKPPEYIELGTLPLFDEEGE